jgi:hypothetical protein
LLTRTDRCAIPWELRIDWEEDHISACLEEKSTSSSPSPLKPTLAGDDLRP